MCNCMRDVYVGIAVAVFVIGGLVFLTVWGYMTHDGNYLLIGGLMTVFIAFTFIMLLQSLYESCKIESEIRKRYNL
jgi:quinol-cytochrome oxidoreductase complex cytochrome b subunit